MDFRGQSSKASRGPRVRVIERKRIEGPGNVQVPGTAASAASLPARGSICREGISGFRMAHIKTLFPPGHFYSPICDPEELILHENELWPPMRRASDPTFDYRVDSQLKLLTAFQQHARDISFPREAPPDSATRYYYNNDQYPCLDAEVLFCMIRQLSPAAIMEVGSGFSTLIMAEVNRRFFDSRIQITCIEPYPRQFLIDGVPGVLRLIRRRVQAVPEANFERLASCDILFVDSSHVAKTGSDVNHILFEILPRIRSGVYVHFHDIFLPDEYPKLWAIDHGRNWNEQYLLRAFLQYNRAFEIVWGSYLMGTRHLKEVQEVFPRYPALGGGGSFWLRRI